MGVCGLFIYRGVKNRPRRMLNRFARKLKKLPEVRAITLRDREVTVVVDKAMAGPTCGSTR